MAEDLAARQAAAMDKLRERFKATIGNTLEAFRQLGAHLGDAPDSPELLSALRRELHRVHGTAGSYGYIEASRIAGKLEARAVEWARDPGLERSARASIVANLVTALEQAFNSDGAVRSADAGVHRTIVTLNLSEEQLAVLKPEAALRGYRVSTFTEMRASPAVMRDLNPVAILASATDALQISDSAEHSGALLIAIGGVDSESRALFKAGIEVCDLRGSASDILDLVDKRERETGMGGTTIVALDDDPAILSLVTQVLARPGLEVITINHSDQLVRTLESSNACLLLMDISMPGPSGVELTQMLREDSRFRELPIVLLSSETDAESRNNALQNGADEFVAKPIAANELRGRIADRLDRLRLKRLADGFNPVTGFPFGPRAVRSFAAVFQEEGNQPLTAVMIRPAIEGNAQFESGLWSKEIRRIALPLLPVTRYVGHHEGDALLLMLTEEPSEVVARLKAIADGAPATAPQWRAGVIGLGDAPSRESDSVQCCAAEAVDVAMSRGEVVHQWQRDEATIAPDVIVVEDDPALSDMLQYALRASGFSYRAFDNGRLALDFLLLARTQGRRPIVLLDVDLPGLDGYSLHEQLAVDRAGDYAVVFVTVHGAETDQLRALKGGAIDFVQKPLNLRILMAKMKSWATMTQNPSRA